jgi:hypothetical protein
METRAVMIKRGRLKKLGGKPDPVPLFHNESHIKSLGQHPEVPLWETIVGREHSGTA